MKRDKSVLTLIENQAITACVEAMNALGCHREAVLARYKKMSGVSAYGRFATVRDLESICSGIALLSHSRTSRLALGFALVTSLLAIVCHQAHVSPSLILALYVCSVGSSCFLAVFPQWYLATKLESLRSEEGSLASLTKYLKQIRPMMEGSEGCTNLAVVQYLKDMALRVERGEIPKDVFLESVYAASYFGFVDMDPRPLTAWARLQVESVVSA